MLLLFVLLATYFRLFNDFDDPLCLILLMLVSTHDPEMFYFTHISIQLHMTVLPFTQLYASELIRFFCINLFCHSIRAKCEKSIYLSQSLVLLRFDLDKISASISAISTHAYRLVNILGRNYLFV